MGQTRYTDWAVTTSEGIIIIDPLFDYSVEAAVADVTLEGAVASCLLRSVVERDAGRVLAWFAGSADAVPVRALLAHPPFGR